MNKAVLLVGLTILGISGVAFAGNQIRLDHDNSEIATLIIVNDNDTECTTKFIIEVFDSDWPGGGKWLPKRDASEQGLILGPGDSYIEKLHVRGATDWRLRTMNNRCKN